MKVLFKGNSVFNDEPMQLKCDLSKDTYEISDAGKHLVIWVNGEFICLNKHNFKIKEIKD